MERNWSRRLPFPKIADGNVIILVGLLPEHFIILGAIDCNVRHPAIGQDADVLEGFLGIVRFNICFCPFIPEAALDDFLPFGMEPVDVGNPYFRTVYGFAAFRQVQCFDAQGSWYFPSDGQVTQDGNGDGPE